MAKQHQNDFQQEASGGRDRASAAGSLVLVVEDDSEIRAGLEEMLVDEGYVVAAARHGQEALAYLSENPVPRLIVLDLLMPTMNGWDLVNRLREDARLASTPIVVVTATGPHWGYPVPASMVVRKPFQRHHLLGVIRQATGDVTPTPAPNRA